MKKCAFALPLFCAALAASAPHTIDRGNVARLRRLVVPLFSERTHLLALALVAATTATTLPRSLRMPSRAVWVWGVSTYLAFLFALSLLIVAMPCCYFGEFSPCCAPCQVPVLVVAAMLLTYSAFHLHMAWQDERQSARSSSSSTSTTTKEQKQID